MSAEWHGHICEIPLNRRKQLWACPDCGQLWRKADEGWKLTLSESEVR